MAGYRSLEFTAFEPLLAVEGNQVESNIIKHRHNRPGDPSIEGVDPIPLDGRPGFTIPGQVDDDVDTPVIIASHHILSGDLLTSHALRWTGFFTFDPAWVGSRFAIDVVLYDDVTSQTLVSWSGESLSTNGTPKETIIEVTLNPTGSVGVHTGIIMAYGLPIDFGVVEGHVFSSVGSIQSALARNDDLRFTVAARRVEIVGGGFGGFSCRFSYGVLI